MTIRASIGLISLLMLLPPQLPADDSTGSCDHHIAQWLDPRSGKVLQGEQLFERLAKANIVLLGEAHTTAAHHRWQAYMLGALHSRRNDMMVGFEMVPRRLQSRIGQPRLLASRSRRGSGQTTTGLPTRSSIGTTPEYGRV